MQCMPLRKEKVINSSTNYLEKSPSCLFPKLKHTTVILNGQLYDWSTLNVTLGQDLGLAGDPFNLIRAALQTGSCLQ